VADSAKNMSPNLSPLWGNANGACQSKLFVYFWLLHSPVAQLEGRLMANKQENLGLWPQRREI